MRTDRGDLNYIGDSEGHPDAPANRAAASPSTVGGSDALPRDALIYLVESAEMSIEIGEADHPNYIAATKQLRAFLQESAATASRRGAWCLNPDPKCPCGLPKRPSQEQAGPDHTQECIDAFYSDGGQSGCICGAEQAAEPGLDESDWHAFVNMVYELIPDGDIRGPIISAVARLRSQQPASDR